MLYLFTCGCGRRSTQVRWPDISMHGRSGKQHLPRKLIHSEQKGAESDNEQQPVSARTRSHGTPEEVLDGPVSSRTGSHNAGAAILAVTGGTPDGKDTLVRMTPVMMMCEPRAMKAQLHREQGAMTLSLALLLG